jgi:hypothetical protein
MTAFFTIDWHAGTLVRQAAWHRDKRGERASITANDA